jgi:antitoxin VapB
MGGRVSRENKQLIDFLAVSIYYMVYTAPEVFMHTAKIFVNGKSQAIRLPKEYRFEGSEVYVNKVGGTVILFSKDDPWRPLFESLKTFTDDFMSDREQPSIQKRRF